MKRLLLLILVSFIFKPVYCQINLADSSVQVISYWTKNDARKYHITEDSYQVVNSIDTTNHTQYTYTVKVEIVDSLAKSYTAKWVYSNPIFTKSSNSIGEKLVAIKMSLPILVRTTEMGEFQDIINWEAMRDSVHNRVTLLRSEYVGQTESINIIDEFDKKYITKESIIQIALEEIQQYYTFHGQLYKLNVEYDDKIKCLSPYGLSNVDVDFNSHVSELNPSEDNSVLRASRVINKLQLTDATYEYVKTLAKKKSIVFNTKRLDFPLAINSNYISSRIEASTGWVFFSIQNKEISIDKVLYIHDRTIEEQ